MSSVSLFVGLAFAGGIAHAADADVVKIDSGALRGLRGNDVVAFKNIPYAAPPVGDLRWRAPAAVQHWTDVRDATAFGNDCLQNRQSWDKAMSSRPTSEDCLYLNVWTPNAKAGAKLPVMFWIHGGGFTSGSGSSPLTIGDKLAAKGVVVVTINYRLGRFGFFAHPALSAESPDAALGNYAFMDQIAALRWAQRNIAAFGGDPAKVTIFGESAGGNSVNNLLLSEAAKGLFAQAISQSGGGRDQWPDLRRDQPEKPSAEAIGVAFAKDVKLKDATTAQLRTLPANKVLGDISLLNPEKKTWSGPMIDGRIVKQPVVTGFAAGKQNKVPLLIGSNGDELGAVPSFFMGSIVKELLPRLGGSKDAVIAAYGSRDAFNASFASDLNFVEPARTIATAAVKSGQATYLYRFNYVIEDKRDDLKGAPHASDVPFIFDQLDASGEKISGADRAAAAKLGALWASFAKTGVPNSEGVGNWKTFNPADDQLYEIGTSAVSIAKAGTPGIDALRKHFDGGAPAAVASETKSVASAAAATTISSPCDALIDTKLAAGKVVATHSVAPPDTIDIGLKGVPPLPVQAAYCRIEATLTPNPGSSIRVEVWLPPKDLWNGKFVGAGNAGYGGDFTSPYLFMGGAVARGYASAGTDTGHVGSAMGENSDSGASWALNAPDKLLDYGHRSNHYTAIAAKALINAYYGAAPKRSYFQGCSNGGREALQAANRYPDDFDGIISGAPANPWTKALAGMAWNARAVAATPEGMPDAKLALITNAVLESCDLIDGVKDGVLEDPRQCKFDPKVLQCKGADAADCLTAGQVDLTRKIYQGPPDAKKQSLYPGFPPGVESIQWGEWITAPASKHAFFSTEFFRYIVFGDPGWDLSKMNFDKDVVLGGEKARNILDASPDMTAFEQSGGKLILWHGWGDAALTPLGSIQYYEKIREKVGPKKTDEFMRFYLAPGMAHCLGGPGPNDFDMLGKLEDWVENGKAPKEVIASKYAVDYARLLGFPPGEPLRTRPLCPYPQIARYKGSGSTDDASNFSCAAPKKK
ncbi:tannase/feruloyl esterase family alpha/beta hydrolase [Solimonas sp. K1W22B-7]|uniref:tannase/feruloyl esterase family alpha/beta hydrolase n=1 Tax=Solimonas sp. K1W22B-7 TaxID=2303331 RepID=UPI0019691962|nr:tannase/feruloyl esterase family alpha/beta hydrolase [Solimonas sp. K1W22B-7]